MKRKIEFKISKMIPNKPKRKQVRHKNIVEYWDGKVLETELNIDFSEALDHCWACGYQKNYKGLI